MKRIALYLMICALTITAGCSSVDEYISVAKRAAISNSYYDVLNTWTREKTVYSQFETAIRVIATLESDEFIHAYRAEYANAYMKDTAYRSPEGDAAITDTDNGVGILLYVYMPDKQSNDLASPRSLWQLALVDETGNTAMPGEIKEIEYITPAIEKLFPYVNKYYGKLYRITFASAVDRAKLLGEGDPAKRTVTLVCAGILGRAELEWKMGPPH